MTAAMLAWPARERLYALRREAALWLDLLTAQADLQGALAERQWGLASMAARHVLLAATGLRLAAAGVTSPAATRPDERWSSTVASLRTFDAQSAGAVERLYVQVVLSHDDAEQLSREIGACIRRMLGEERPIDEASARARWTAAVAELRALTDAIGIRRRETGVVR